MIRQDTIFEGYLQGMRLLVERIVRNMAFSNSVGGDHDISSSNPEIIVPVSRYRYVRQATESYKQPVEHVSSVQIQDGYGMNIGCGGLWKPSDERGGRTTQETLATSAKPDAAMPTVGYL